MEMLAEMEGTEEDLKGLNHAEHKPEDDMQTDEWMYELKHRKSWSTGRYVPSDDTWKPKKVPVTETQVKLVGSTFAQVKDTTEFGGRLHDAVVAKKPVPALNRSKQAKVLGDLVKAMVEGLADNSRLPLSIPVLQQQFDAYGLCDGEVLTVFGAALQKTLAATLSGFTDDVKTAWELSYNLLVLALLDASDPTKKK